MTGSYKLTKIISQINKSPVLNNATTAIGNATERAQQKFVDIQNLANQKYGSIVKNIHGSTIIQNLQAAALEPSPPLPKRLIYYWQWYQKVVGLEEVELAKQSVINIQNTLFKCQDRRRELTHQAAQQTEKLKSIYSELLNIRRDDPKYVQLTIQENKTLQEQSKITDMLSFLEKEERDYFTQLATAIKEYHDAQTMNAQKYKYLSIVASISIAVASLLGTMIYNNKRISDMNLSIANAQVKTELMFKVYFENLEKKLGISSAMTAKQIDKMNSTISFFGKDPGLKRHAEYVMNAEQEFPENLDMEKVKTFSVYIGVAMIAIYLINKLA